MSSQVELCVHDSETLSRIRSLVGYIIATRESDFSEATTTADDINGR
jgi:hypothetical protein